MTSQYSVVINTNASSPIRTGYTFVQGDKGISFQIIVNELDFASTSAKIVFHRANGTSVESAATYAGNVVSYTTLGNEFAVPGIVVADVKFYDGDTQRVSTASFIFNVNEDTLDGLGGGTAGYSDELEVLREQLEEESALFSQTLQEYIDAFGAVGAIHPAGDWNNVTEYHVLDLVWHNGASWIAKLANTNQTPQAGSIYWQQFTDYGSEVMGALSAITNVYNAKNFAKVTIQSGTYYGIVLTVNADDTISLSGSNTLGDVLVLETCKNFKVPVSRDYIISGGISPSINIALYDETTATYIGSSTGGESIVTMDASHVYTISLVFATGVSASGTIKPMIRDSRIPDSTYVPFCYTNRQLLSFKDNGVLGCKNFAPNNAVSGVHASVTFTVNADKSVSTSGTADSTYVFELSEKTYKAGTYKLSGCPSDGSASTYCLWFRNADQSFHAEEYGSGATITLTADTYMYWGIVIYAGANTTGKTFKPMITLATDTDPTYQPFSKTNQQLTTDKAERTDLSDIIINGTTNNTGSTIEVGEYFYLNGQYCRASTDIASGATFTLNTNYTVVNVGNQLNSRSVSLTAGAGVSSISVRRVGTMCLVTGYCASLSLAAWDTMTICTFNEGVQVKAGGFIPVIAMNNVNNSLIIEVSSSGLLLRNWSATPLSSTEIRFCGAFC